MTGLNLIGRMLSTAATLGLLLAAQPSLSRSATAGEAACRTLQGGGVSADLSANWEDRSGEHPDADLPMRFCRAVGTLKPVPESRIGFQLWLPENWNGRLIMFGNGGYSSALPTAQMAAYVEQGYAVVGTDTGHQGDDPSFAAGRPDAIDDWAWRAVHETAVGANALVRRHYGRDALYRYFSGCSTGGHQALMEAQRFPHDFDGILAGAPGNNRTRLNIGFLWQFIANHRGDGSLILPAPKLKLLSDAALAQCGGEKALRRGYLTDPFSCRVDLEKIACGSRLDSTCLSPEELAAVQRMQSGARDPQTGVQIYPPWLPGSENVGPPGMPLPGWSLYWADPANPKQPMRVNFFKDWVFKDRDWDWRGFDFSDLSPLTHLSDRIDAVSPDLDRFKQAGGKLIQYHGLADPVVSPWDSRNYADALAARYGEESGSFYRLFFFPGMAHCGGGPGPNPADPLKALEAWVEQGIAPASLEVVQRANPAEASPAQGSGGAPAIEPYRAGG